MASQQVTNDDDQAMSLTGTDTASAGDKDFEQRDIYEGPFSCTIDKFQHQEVLYERETGNDYDTSFGQKDPHGNKAGDILDAGLSEETRIILIGKTGVGKSATANTILQRKQFESKVSAISVTQSCQMDTVIKNDESILVVDTPGLFDTGMSEEKLEQEILKCLAITAPGPHVILYVLKCSRFTKEDVDTAEKLEQLFPNMFKNAIIVFTGLDQLEDDEREFDDFLEEIYGYHECMRTFIEQFAGRVFPINNRAKGKKGNDMVDKFFMMVKELKNKTPYYTNHLISDIEKEIQEKRTEQLGVETTTSQMETIKSRMAIRYNILNEEKWFQYLKVAVRSGMEVFLRESMAIFLNQVANCSIL